MPKSIDWKELKDAALQVRKNAYAPYSSFWVGAAIFANGAVHVGCNVENVSYPVGICAERAALCAAVAAGCKEIDAVVVAGPGSISPCGMCRQALAEFGAELDEGVPVLLLNVDTNQETITSLRALLPAPFQGDQ